MSPEQESEKLTRKRLLHEFRDDLWGLLKAEAKKQGRTPPRQLEVILEERYRPEELGRTEIEMALELAKAKDYKKAAPRPRKSTKKRAGGR